MTIVAYRHNLLKTLLSVLILSIWGSTALAQTSEIPAAFVDLGYGARPMGMGGAYVALADDANALLWNPAGLCYLDRPQLTGMYANQMGLLPYGFVGYAHPFSESTSLGLGAIYSGDAALGEMTVLLSMARRLIPGLSLGLSAKTRWAGFGHNSEGAWDPGGGNRQVQGHALGFGCDLGLIYAISHRTTVGLMWRDVLAPVSWEAQNDAGTAVGQAESIPMALAVGTAYRMGDGQVMSVNLDRSLTADSDDELRLGYESGLWDLLFLRLGYGQELNVTPERHYAMGMGVCGDVGETWNVQFDIAYLFHQQGNTPRVSFTISF